jgi:hypothetical protein
VTAAFFDLTFPRKRSDCGTKIDPIDRSGGPFAITVLHPDHDGRTIEFFLKAGRDDTDNTGVPTFAGSPNKWAVYRTLLSLLYGQFQNTRFQFTTICVQAIKFMGQSFRFFAGAG